MLRLIVNMIATILGIIILLLEAPIDTENLTWITLSARQSQTLIIHQMKLFCIWVVHTL